MPRPSNSKLNRKKKGSENYQEKKLELARKHEKISNRMKKLVNNCDLIGLEDLKSKEMTERKPNQKRKQKTLLEQVDISLAQFLSYKVKQTSKEVIMINPKNTTQRYN